MTTATDGDLWSLVRDIMAAGACMLQDFELGRYPSYENFAARIDAKAGGFVKKLKALFAEGSK